MGPESTETETFAAHTPRSFDRVRWEALCNSAAEAPGHAMRPQARRSSTGRPWPGLFVWHQVGPAGDLYIPPQHSHCIVLRRSTPTTLVYRRGASLARSAWRPGDALVIPAGEPSYWHSADARDNVHIAIDPTWLVRASGREVRVRDENCRHDAVIASFADVLLGSLESSTSMQRSFGEHIAMAIAIHLIEHYADHQNEATAALTRRQMETVASAVAERLNEKWPLIRLAGLLGQSPFHFARSFKASFGIPPHAYVSTQRMEAAARLMRETRKTIEQIALDTGYASAAHFSQAFKSHWGVTPSAYRRAS